MFRRPKISFFGIFSYQVIISGSKIYNFGTRKSVHPAMYHSTIPIHFPRSSLRTDRQTNKKKLNTQKDMIVLSLYMTREVTRVYFRGNFWHALDATAGMILPDVA